MSPILVAPHVLSWASDLDPNAAVQAGRTARMPFVEGHVALMPDAHVGMGATVGSVIPTKGAIIPAAVGVDIGCGMIAARLNITSNGLPDDLGKLHELITKMIPSGVGKGFDNPLMSIPGELPDALVNDSKLRETAHKQMGSLGSGNHFVEVCLDELDRVWLVLHSGSRGVGNKLGVMHIDKAKGLMKKYLIGLEDPDLAYLVEDTPEFDSYIKSMLWAQDYAMMNRERMLTSAMAALWCVENNDSAQIVEQINCHHNFTQREHHRGQNVWLTRKGAIKADTGDRGVIPGSMGTRSYIVTGLGNKQSYCSCSHGAGRRLSRTKAKDQLSYESLVEAMAGKVWNESVGLVDEHPSAYKDIDQVMDDQKDLVRIDHTLHQILNYKGA